MNGEERQRTNRAYKLADLEKLPQSDDFWGMPMIRNNHFIPKELIGFNFAKSSENIKAGIHFFIDDYQFERVWTSPQNYTEKLSQYSCILTPDFSLYLDMPMPLKIWNIYRSRFIGSYYQDKGLNVIPTLSWAEEETFRFAFKGIPKGSIVAVSTLGVKRDKYATWLWREGMQAMIAEIQPSDILIYGRPIEFDFKNAKIHYYDNQVLKKWKE